MKIIKLLILSIFLLILNPINGQSIWTNPITGTNPNLSNPYTTGDSKDIDISVSGIARGSGISGNNANNRYNASGWTTSTSIDLNDYFQFTITPASGYKIDFANFVYTGQKSSSGPTSFAIRTSLDGYASNIATPPVGGTTLSLSGSSYQGISSSITFRVYGWSAGGGSGTYSIDDFIFSGFVYSTTKKNGLIINEFSQGETGGSNEKEYIELLTVGTPCTSIDISGYIIDDNNGLFSSGDLTAGVATGHVRFSKNILWRSIPVGTLILIYNGSDISSSISTPLDTVIGSNYSVTIPLTTGVSNNFFIYNTSSPSSSSSVYNTNPYSTTVSWTSIGLNNSCDGVQIRNPDTSFCFGVGYGSCATTHPDLTSYTPNHLLFSSGGSNVNWYLSDTTGNNDFRNKLNWTTSTGSGTRTPGSPNNNANIEYMKYLTCSTLPIELNKFTATCNESNTTVYFSTLSQSNVDYFYLQKSIDGINWADFAWFKGKKYSSQLDEYRATDDSKYKYYYRIKEVDLDGTIIYSNVIYSSCLNTDNDNAIDIKVINNNILNIQTNSNQKLILTLYSIDGKLIKSDIVQNSFQTSLDALSRGIYVTSLISESGQINIVKKILIK